VNKGSCGGVLSRRTSKGINKSSDDLCPCDLRRIEDEEDEDDYDVDFCPDDELIKGPYGLPTEALIPKMIPSITSSSAEPPMSLNYSPSILKVTSDSILVAPRSLKDTNQTGS